MLVITSVRRQAADFEQLKPEGLDLGEHAVQRGLVRQRSGQHGVLSTPLSPQGGERGAHRLAQVTAHPNLVSLRPRPAVRAGHVVTSHETGQLPTVVPAITGLMVKLLPPRRALVTSLDAVRGNGQRTIRMMPDAAQPRARKVAGEAPTDESQDSASSAGDRVARPES